MFCDGENAGAYAMGLGGGGGCHFSFKTLCSAAPCVLIQWLRKAMKRLLPLQFGLEETTENLKPHFLADRPRHDVELRFPQSASY